MSRILTNISRISVDAESGQLELVGTGSLVLPKGSTAEDRRYIRKSTTSLSFSSSSGAQTVHTLVVEGTEFTPWLVTGSDIFIYSAGAPSVNAVGTITGYNHPNLEITFDSWDGDDTTHSDWNIGSYIKLGAYRYNSLHYVDLVVEQPDPDLVEFRTADNSPASYIRFTNIANAGTYVRRAGDTMTGNLDTPSADIAELNIGTVVNLPDGTASAPSLTFSDDPNTGIFRSGSDTLDFVAGGTDVLKLIATGVEPLKPILAIDGTTGNPAYSWATDSDTGFSLGAPGTINVITSGTSRISVSDTSTQISNNLIVDGDLTIGGTTTTVSSENLEVSDNLVKLNVGESGAGVSLGTSGMEIDRGSLDDVRWVWNETNGWFGPEGTAKLGDIDSITLTNTGKILTLIGTGGLVLPSGTTGNRPTTSVGTIRWNTTTNKLEFYNVDSNWHNYLDASKNLLDVADITEARLNLGIEAITMVSDTFTSDGSVGPYTLPAIPVNESGVIVILGGVVQQTDSYTIVGDQLTFSEALDESLEGEFRVFKLNANVNNRFVSNPFATFTNNSTTPTVANGSRFKASNSAATVITNFTSGINGQTISVLATNDNTSIANNSNIKTTSSSTISLHTDDIVEFIYDGSKWYQTTIVANSVPAIYAAPTNVYLYNSDHSDIPEGIYPANVYASAAHYSKFIVKNVEATGSCRVTAMVNGTAVTSPITVDDVDDQSISVVDLDIVEGDEISFNIDMVTDCYSVWAQLGN